MNFNRTGNNERVSPTLVVSTKNENVVDVENKLSGENKIIEKKLSYDDTNVSLQENSQITKPKSLENTPELQNSKVTDVKKLISNIEETKKSDVHSFTNENHSKSTTFKKGNILNINANVKKKLFIKTMRIKEI